MKLDLDKAEWHNFIKRGGRIGTRPGFVYENSPLSSANEYVAGFTVQSTNTQEPWHYLIERVESTGLAYLYVYTEEYESVIGLELGYMPKDIVVSHAIVNRQIMINSPSFSAPFYGHVGGGLIPAVKIESEDPLATARDIPPGHVCEFGGRIVIAEGSRLHFNEPRSDLDIRTFTDAGVVALPGQIHHMLTGPDGRLYIFTSAGTFTMPPDAAGAGASPSGFISTISTVPSLGPQCAATSNGVIAYLTRTGIAFVGGGEPVDMWTYRGRKYALSTAMWGNPYAEDIRVNARLFAGDSGFWVALRNTLTSFEVNLVDGYSSFWDVNHAPAGNSCPVGMLRSYEGRTLPVTSEGVVHFIDGRSGCQLPIYTNSTTIQQQQARMYISVPSDVGQRLKGLRIAASNDTSFAVYVDGTAVDTTCAIPAQSGAAIIGTSTWDQSSKAFTMRIIDTVALPVGVRGRDIGVEIYTTRAASTLEYIDAVVGGQGRNRKGGAA